MKAEDQRIQLPKAWNELMNIVYWSPDLVFTETKLLQRVRFGFVVVKMQPSDRPRTAQQLLKFGWRPDETYTLVYDQPVAGQNFKDVFYIFRKMTGVGQLEKLKLILQQNPDCMECLSQLSVQIQRESIEKLLSDLLPDASTYHLDQSFGVFNMQLFLDATGLSRLQEIIQEAVPVEDIDPDEIPDHLLPETGYHQGSIYFHDLNSNGADDLEAES